MNQRDLVSIRAANISDVDHLITLGRQTFHDTFAAYNSPDDMAAYLRETFTSERVLSEITDPNSIFLLAESDSKLIGFAKLVSEAPPECVTGRSAIRLSKLYVSTQAIGSGIGAALMRASLDWSTLSGYETLWLGVWEHNDRARAFYQRWNFTPVGTEIFQLGSDRQTDILMQLDLRNQAHPSKSDSR